MLFFFSNKDNKVNRWCSAAGFIFWLGVAKESFMYNVVPYLQSAWGYIIPYGHYKGAYSAMTWVLYSFAAPTALIFSLYFSGMDAKRPEITGKLKLLVYLPGLLLSLLFSPLEFHEYQLDSLPFWITYAIYNLCFVTAYTYFIVRGIRGGSRGKAGAQKRLAGIVVLSPVLYWYITVFPTHTLGLRGLLKVWRGNAFILFACIVIYIFMAFKEGFMGLRLTGETYQWNSDLRIINKGAEYTSHMLKNQTVKMEWCIENLRAQYVGADGDVPEEFAILSRSISTLKSYVDKIRRHSETIYLLEEDCDLRGLLENSVSASAEQSQDAVSVQLSVENNVHVLCDKIHMGEAFANIISNAIEAARDVRTIEIEGKYDGKGRFYLLSFTDHGAGISGEDLKNIFTPYFTSKNTEKNFGLGLSYCKNVVEKHGGQITAESEPGRGTTIVVALPVKRIVASGVSNG